MPNHLQSRSDDMHEGKARKSRFSPTTAIIILAIIGVVTAILALT